MVQKQKYESTNMTVHLPGGTATEMSEVMRSPRGRSSLSHSETPATLGKGFASSDLHPQVLHLSNGNNNCLYNICRALSKLGCPYSMSKQATIMQNKNRRTSICLLMSLLSFAFLFMIYRCTFAYIIFNIYIKLANTIGRVILSSFYRWRLLAEFID